MNTISFAVLSKAIEKHFPAAIGIVAKNKRSAIHVKLASESTAPGEEGFWVEVVGGDAKLLDQLIASRHPVELCFNDDGAKVFFDTVVLKKKRLFMFNRMVLLENPQNVQVVEQRKNTREWIPEDLDISAQVTRPSTSSEFSARLWDLSTGGASLICPIEKLADLQSGEDLAVEIQFAGNSLKLAARHCYAQSLSVNSIRIGVQFTDPANLPLADAASFKALLEDLENQRVRRGFRESLGGRR
jgi:hypothetical protein